MAQGVRSARPIARFAVIAKRSALSISLGLALGPALGPTTPGAATPAHTDSMQVRGIRNFGCVTPMLYRGGDFIPYGVRSLTHLGVRTVISLRSHSRHGEPDSCAAHGIAYYLFPMTTHAVPSAAAMDSVLDIIRHAKAPVYVHCTAGEHRTGTVCALYRIRVQGWSPERAWTEQQTYGFGVPEHHLNLIHFVYGDSFPLTP